MRSMTNIIEANILLVYLMIGWLIILYCIMSRAIISPSYGDAKIAGEGLQNLDLNPDLTAFGHLYCAPPDVTRDKGFCFSS